MKHPGLVTNLRIKPMRQEKLLELSKDLELCFEIIVKLNLQKTV